MLIYLFERIAKLIEESRYSKLKYVFIDINKIIIHRFYK
jgi:hypothetical protein